MKAIWIPVEDRLPEEERTVLLCFRSGEIITGSCERSSRTGEPYWMDNATGYWAQVCARSDVIAWCELPEPYHPLSISPSALNLRENYGGTH